MNLNDYITAFEEKLEQLEYKKIGLLEADKDVRYTNKKIMEIEDLITILKNCKRTEEIVEKNTFYTKLSYMIEDKLNKIEKAIRENNKEKEIKEKESLIENLKKELNYE